MRPESCWTSYPFQVALSWIATFLIAAFVVLAAECSPTPAQAELYLQAQGGVSRPFDWSEWRGEYSYKNLYRHDDLKLKSGGAIGAKVGYCFAQTTWLCFEADYLWTTPHLKEQDSVLHPVFPALGPAVADKIPGSHFHVQSLSANTMFRYPGERWQPYLAFGPAYFTANQGGASMLPTIGLNAETGLKYRLTDHWLMALSYKYQQVRMILPEVGGAGQSALYQNQFVLVGIGYVL